MRTRWIPCGLDVGLGSADPQVWYHDSSVIDPDGPMAILDSARSDVPFPTGRSCLQWTEAEKHAAFESGYDKGYTAAQIAMCGPCSGYARANPSLPPQKCARHIRPTEESVNGVISCSTCVDRQITGCDHTRIHAMQAQFDNFKRYMKNKENREQNDRSGQSSRR